MEISFEDWVAGVFDHPVTEPEWYWAPEAADWNLQHERALQLLTQLFEQPAELLRCFSDAQVNQGFWFLLGPRGDAMGALDDENPPRELRWRCVRSFSSLFQDVFAARCTPHLSHLLRTDVSADPGLSPLNEICYMWWDLIWSTWHKEHIRRTISGASLEVMKQTLALPHDACRESALHGLSHWHQGHPLETEFIIDNFLRQAGPIRDERRDSAQQARQGCVL